MEYVILVFLLILISTIKPKYLGGLKFLSLEKFLSSYNTKIIRYSLLLAFILYIIIVLFKKELTSYWYSLTEGFTSSPQENRTVEILVNNGNFLSTNWLTIPNTSDITSLNDFTFTIDMAGYWINQTNNQGSSAPGIIGKYNDSTYIIGTQSSGGYAQMVKIEFQINNGLQVKAIDSANRNPDNVSSVTSDNIVTHWDNLSTSFDGVTTNYADGRGYGVNNLIINVPERVNTDYSPAPQEFPGSISPDANTMVAADRYIARAEVYTRNNEYQEALDNYQKALNIKLELATNTQQDQIAAIYDAISNIYGDMAAAAGCDYQDDPNSEECNTANNYLQQQQENYNLSLKYYEKDIYYESGGAPDSWTPGAYAPEASQVYESSMATGLEPDDVTPEPIYYQPGTVSYGGAGYQPTDVDIAYFRNYKSTPASLFVVDETENPNGFCDLKDTLVNMDQKCSEQPLDVCASTNCCVLMGGQKCVYGNEFGPINKTVYSDTSIKNRDVYYYRGKCYGDCI